MLGRITLGQFVPGNSIVHRLNPVVKVLAVITGTLAIFVWPGIKGILISSLYLALIILPVAKLIRFVFRGLWPLWVIITFTFVFHAFSVPGETVFSLAFLHMTKEGLEKALIFVGRLVMVVMLVSVLTLTTSPVALTHALEKILSPFKRIGVPAHELSMMMTIALRFIPTLVSEAEVIMKAQRSRGADFTQGGLVDRIKALVPFIVPLLAGSLRRAEELAVAMESRCYRGGINRTSMNQMYLGKTDYLALIITAAFLGMAITYRFAGW
ncbi:energy-coupling factor transporter transmembrane component T family protein [Desulfofalx alkaliphila]|uniref:energy-coupling factor transporter transmembrane component T family protein n=1 Tax=Desulfofalx alkaliphila TaxID=105483 RepID=UPI0004E15AA8|nr:energy-coupling factor transporter transmembrane component T [Desulfofalx alkaliphila]